MAMPPCFMKKRRENFAGRTPSQQWLLMASPSLKFGSAEDEAGDYAQIDLFDGVVEARIDNGYDRAEATSALTQLVSA